jgi:hypothetical protein
MRGLSPAAVTVIAVVAVVGYKLLRHDHRVVHNACAVYHFASDVETAKGFIPSPPGALDVVAFGPCDLRNERRRAEVEAWKQRQMQRAGIPSATLSVGVGPATMHSVPFVADLSRPPYATRPRYAVERRVGNQWHVLERLPFPRAPQGSFVSFERARLSDGIWRLCGGFGPECTAAVRVHTHTAEDLDRLLRRRGWQRYPYTTAEIAIAAVPGGGSATERYDVGGAYVETPLATSDCEGTDPCVVYASPDPFLTQRRLELRGGEPPLHVAFVIEVDSVRDQSSAGNELGLGSPG